MDSVRTSNRIYLSFIALLSVFSAMAVFLPQGTTLPVSPEAGLPASRPMLALIGFAVAWVLYGGLGYVGLRLARELDFAHIWDPKISHRQRLGIPAFWGLLLGLVFIMADQGFSTLHAQGPLPHPPFPTSLVASATASIGEEILFRLFFVSLLVWLVSYKILGKRHQTAVFWGAAVASGLAFAGAHLPALMFIVGVEQVSALSPWFLVEIVLLNGVLSLVAADLLRRYGFLAAIGVHFWTDVVWHVLWGAIG